MIKCLLSLTFGYKLEQGLEGLPDEVRERYVPDPAAFVAAVKNEGFPRYAEQVIVFDRSMTKIDASSKETAEVSRSRLIAKNMLVDEAIANILARERQQSGNVVISILDSKKVKFGYGVEERLKRRFTDTPAAAPNTAAEVYSVLLNPTAADSLSDTFQLRLSLAYGSELPFQKPLADYLWFSDSPPSKILTRPKNAISKEGDQPEGESSIIGAF